MEATLIMSLLTTLCQARKQGGHNVYSSREAQKTPFCKYQFSISQLNIRRASETVITECPGNNILTDNALHNTGME